MDATLIQQAIAPATKVARTPYCGQRYTEPTPVVDQRMEVAKFRGAITAVEPYFDISLADRDVLNSIFAWVWRRDDINALALDYRKGLWLYGSMGRGKTVTLKALRKYMTTISKAVRKEDYRLGLQWKTASELATIYAAGGQAGLMPYCAHDVNLVIDELGREPNPASNYGTRMNVLQFVLQTRYENRHESVTCVTTNLGVCDIAKHYGDYVADRCLEMFNFIEFSGKSLRGD